MCSWYGYLHLTVVSCFHPVMSILGEILILANVNISSSQAVHVLWRSTSSTYPWECTIRCSQLSHDWIQLPPTLLSGVVTLDPIKGSSYCIGTIWSCITACSWYVYHMSHVSQNSTPPKKKRPFWTFPFLCSHPQSHWGLGYWSFSLFDASPRSSCSCLDMPKRLGWWVGGNGSTLNVQTPYLGKWRESEQGKENLVLCRGDV